MNSTLFADARELIKAGNLMQAIGVLLAIGSADPDYANAQMTLGVICYDSKQWKRAEGHFLEASKDGGRMPPEQKDFVDLMLERAQRRASLTEQEFTAFEFDRLAHKYDRANADAGNVAPRQCVDAVARFIVPAGRAGIAVLDLCCGTGQAGPLLRRALKDLNLTLTGIDLSPKSLALARGTQAYDTLILGDAMQSDLGTSRFDAIISADAVYFFPDLGALFSRVTQALKIGGCLCFNMPIPEGAEVKEVWYAEHRHTHFSRPKIVQEAKAAGLVPQEVIETSAYVSIRQGKIPACIYVLQKS